MPPPSRVLCPKDLEITSACSFLGGSFFMITNAQRTPEGTPILHKLTASRGRHCSSTDDRRPSIMTIRASLKSIVYLFVVENRLNDNSHLQECEAGPCDDRRKELQLKEPPVLLPVTHTCQVLLTFSPNFLGPPTLPTLHPI